MVCFTYCSLLIVPSSHSASPMISNAAWLVDATVCGLKPARASPIRTTLSPQYRFFGEITSVMHCTNGFLVLCAISAICGGSLSSAVDFSSSQASQVIIPGGIVILRLRPSLSVMIFSRSELPSGKLAYHTKLSSRCPSDVFPFSPAIV